MKINLAVLHKYRIAVICGLVSLIAILSFLFVGCSKNLSGEMKADAKPIVQFVNIPPDGQQFSRNPIVYWYGTDIDGIISFYRYHVATISMLNGSTPEAYIAGVDSADWKYLYVDPTGEQSQQTQVSISLVADSLDPVLSSVSQYVFIQAFDNEDASSDIKYRLFSRNDNPPQTLLFGSLSGSKDAPYVNAPTAGGVITGVRFNWQGSDPIDYPSDAPPFEFEWKLFGPYTDAQAAQLHAQFVVKRFVTREGKVFNIGDTLFHCNDDTSHCDTVIVNTTNTTRIATIFGADYGVFDSTFLAGDPAFVNDNDPVNGLYKLAASSSDGVDSWITKTADTIYNVFASQNNPTTTQRQFIFWLRSRDDAQVPDLVPAFRFVYVIDPRYERDAFVIDFTFRGNTISGAAEVLAGASKKYFKRAMLAWNPASTFDTTLDTLTAVGDYVSIQQYGAGRRIPIAWLLSHKMMILYNDNTAQASLDVQPNYYTPIFTAIDGGVNAWVTARCPLSVGAPAGPNEGTQLIVAPRNSSYITYFGTLGMAYSGWLCHAISPTCLRARIEDFVGGITLMGADPGWPDVAVDSSKLSDTAIFAWRFPGNIHIPALPEVNWSERITPGTEGLYLYKSYYGNQHPLGGAYSMQGAPCAHRFNTGLYRTVHFNFTPVVMDSASMQTVFNSVLDWLLETGNTSPTADLRYPDAPMPMSKETQRRNYQQRMAEQDKAYFQEHPEEEFIR